ncbi:PQQ-binding-like beta-propeller repeat protein [Streptomyces sp. NPDC041003]|uniref:serine/threonine-protein kinase n=1 Tax=Streptomyces sp. NPDC041003 TaxID=3155730 RepID=UPI0033D9C002
MDLSEEAVTHIGHYEVERILGAGGMGVVYLAVSPSGRQAAVKVIRERFASDPLFRVRFAREVEAARAVSGAFTAPVIDADTTGDLPWMATLYVPGPTLAEQVAADGPMAADEAWQLASGLVEALRDIHRAGLVHRDLKPGNILLADDGPRVIDFGISRAIDSDALTQTGVIVGTPPFMAPEQFRAPKETGPAADVFALGSVLVHAATGRSPFEAESPYAIAWNVVHEPPALDGLPQSLLPVVGPCLAKEPADRPTADDLLALLGSRAHRRRSGRAAQPVRTAGTRRRVKAGVAAGIALTIAAGSATAWALYPDPPKAPPAAAASGPSAPAAPAREDSAAIAPAGWARWETPIPPGISPPASRSVLHRCLWTGKDVLCEGENGIAQFDGATGKVLPTAADGAAGTVTLVAAVPATGLAYLMLGGTPELGEESRTETLAALDTRTGTFRWQRPVAVTAATDAALVGDVLVTGDPNENVLRAWSAASGEPLWTREFAEHRYVRLLHHPAGLLVEGMPKGDGGGPEAVLLRLSPSDGKTQWQRGTHGLFSGIGGDQDTLIAVDDLTGRPKDSSTGRLVQVSAADGKDLPGRAAVQVSAQAVASDSVVIDLRADGRLRAVDLVSGKELWVEDTGADPLQGPVLQDGLVYVQTTNGEIVTRDAGTGRELWRSAPRRDPEQPVSRGGIGAFTLIVQDGTAYGASSRSTVFALSPPR